jgi:hypothetical protein
MPDMVSMECDYINFLKFFGGIVKCVPISLKGLSVIVKSVKAQEILQIQIHKDLFYHSQKFFWCNFSAVEQQTVRKNTFLTLKPDSVVRILLNKLIFVTVYGLEGNRVKCEVIVLDKDLFYPIYELCRQCESI